MRLKNIKDGNIIGSYVQLMNDFCYRHPCEGCMIEKKSHGFCIKWIKDHPYEASRLLGYEVVEEETPLDRVFERARRNISDFDNRTVKRTEPSGNPGELNEANMDKPRICDVLGVEVGEKFKVRGKQDILSIKKDGSIIFDGDPAVKDLSLLLLWLVYHPEDIERIEEKPRFTEQEVERAKAIKVLWPEIYAIKNDGAWTVLIGDVDNKSCAIETVARVLFPSAKFNVVYTLDEIIGGAE